MADKLALPKAKFKHELTAAPVDPTMKAAEATTTKLYRVPVDKIKPIPGFNVRVESPDYIAHRDGIQNSIQANGYDQTKPLAGYVAKDGDENVIYVTDGHTRLSAVLNHNADAEKEDRIKILPVLVHSKDVSLTDLTVALHTANNGRPLTPLELGTVVNRLLSEEGATKAEIARRLSVSGRYLEDVLLLATSDAKIRQHVASGNVSGTMAIELLKEDPKNALKEIEGAVEKVAGTGKKATKKHVAPKVKRVKANFEFDAGDDMKEIVKSLAAEVRNAVPAVEGEDDTKLSTVGGTIIVVIELPVEEKPKSKAKKPTAKKSKAKPKKDDLGIEGAELAEDEDAEIAKLPPKVHSDDDDDEVDI